MGRIGDGYGSEHHLRTLMATKNADFESSLLDALGPDRPSRIEWHPNYHTVDGLELRGVDFLPDTFADAWKDYWPDPRAWRDPRRAGIQNWDGVGRLYGGDEPAWLLLEAKAHLGEFRTSSPCKAGEASRQSIQSAFQQTRLSMGLTKSLVDDVPEAWFTAGGYQIANRLAALNFLLNEKPAAQAHLIFVYFVDAIFPGVDCPKTEGVWREVIRAKYDEMGIPENHEWKARVHYVFPNFSQLSGGASNIPECR